MLKTLFYKIAGLLLPPSAIFATRQYERMNRRRQEHLASLQLPIHDCSVLEVGAGVGDHTQFFIDRGCNVTITEARPKNLSVLRKRYPSNKVIPLNMDTPHDEIKDTFDIIYCYGLLYHLENPDVAIKYMAEKCARFLLLETCVSYGDDLSINLVSEHKFNVSQSVTGTGCRPTRAWVHNEMKKHFPHVYLPRTQPSHEQFPVDWSARESGVRLTRAVFIGSRDTLDNPLLQEMLPTQQARV